MENRRDTEKVLFSVQRATLLMDPFFKVAATGTILLITHFARLCKEGKLSKGNFNGFQEFAKLTEGRFSIENIPSENKWLGRNSFDQYTNELRSLGIRYTVLPDLDKKDGFIQIAVFDDDKQKFQAWYTRYLMDRMKGGEHNILELRNLTGGKTNIISVPFENNPNIILDDFKKLNINYALLPDLNVGDGEIQFLIANSDMPQVEYWYKMYQAQQLEQGNEIHDLTNITMEQYTETGILTEEQYIDSSSADLKEAIAKYEGKAPGEIENSIRSQEQQIRSVSDEAYLKLHENPEYREITINQETLIEKSRYAGTDSVTSKGLFASRIPSTYGSNEKTLVIPTNNVFSIDDGKTYVAFIKKNEAPIVLNPEGKVYPLRERMTGEELYNQYYAQVSRKIKNTKQLENPSVTPSTQFGKTAKEKIPSVPIKIK